MDKVGDEYYEDGVIVDEDNQPAPSEGYRRSYKEWSRVPEETNVASITGNQTDLFGHLRHP